MATIIAAHDQNRVIGLGDNMPWHGELPADMQHFRQLTLGKTVVMGRTTFDSIGRPLPRRKNIVLTRDEAFSPVGVELIHSSDELVELIETEDDLMIIGGRQIYILSLPYANSLELTVIHHQFDGDVHFPEIDPQQWSLVSQEDFKADELNKYDYSFLRYEHV